MWEFARTYPNFGRARNLSWSHYQALLRVNEPEARERLTKEAVRNKWTRDTLRREINKLKSAKKITLSETPPEELLIPRKGVLDTYRIITAKAGPWAGERAVDLGFANYWVLDPRQAKRFKDREIIKGGRFALTAAKGASEADLFTYRAYLLQVTDGDTLWCLIDLGFSFVTHQPLRLRGIDCPELTRQTGLEAKRFVEDELKRASSIIVKTSKSDKYDRYLADLFYTLEGEEHFLNNRLLERGLAERAKS